jgi:hypothetical protein
LPPNPRGLAHRSPGRLGAPILALDPGPALLDVARARLADFANVRFTEATFEEWPMAPAAFKLVAAAVFGNVSMPLKAPLGPALDRLYRRYAPRLIESAPGDWYLPGGVLTKLFADTQLFGPATHKAYPWTRRHDAADYVALLCTRSDCQMLDPAARDALTAAVAEAIETHGGAFEAGYEAHLYIARRL